MNGKEININEMVEIIKKLDWQLHDAFLREKEKDDWDWTDRITNEQYNAITDISLFFTNIYDRVGECKKKLPLDFGMFKNHSRLRKR